MKGKEMQQLLRMDGNHYRDKIGMRHFIPIFIIFIFMTYMILVIVPPHFSEMIEDPFFWAALGMFALMGSSATLFCNTLKRFPFYNILFVGLFAICRFTLVLPFLPQPRFEMLGLNLIIGALFLILGLVFLIPIFDIKPFPSQEDKVILNTSGFYNLTRNPIYLGEILWTLGWSVSNASVIGVALVPLWWFGLLFVSIFEEEELERNLGLYYLRYKNAVSGRIIPGLPI